MISGSKNSNKTCNLLTRRVKVNSEQDKVWEEETMSEMIKVWCEAITCKTRERFWDAQVPTWGGLKEIR